MNADPTQSDWHDLSYGVPTSNQPLAKPKLSAPRPSVHIHSAIPIMQGEVSSRDMRGVAAASLLTVALSKFRRGAG